MYTSNELLSKGIHNLRCSQKLRDISKRMWSDKKKKKRKKEEASDYFFFIKQEQLPSTCRLNKRKSDASCSC